MSTPTCRMSSCSGSAPSVNVPTLGVLLLLVFVFGCVAGSLGLLISADALGQQVNLLIASADPAIDMQPEYPALQERESGFFTLAVVGFTLAITSGLGLALLPIAWQVTDRIAKTP